MGITKTRRTGHADSWGGRRLAALPLGAALLGEGAGAFF